jgi:predicted phosphodiesterase
MKIAAISDMHGNHVALEAVLQDLKKVSPDQIVCLGDAIQGGAQPVEVVQTLREERIPTVMGNADAWLLSGIFTAGENFSPERLVTIEEVRQWSFSKLSEDDKAYISAFKPAIELDLPLSQKLLCFHGTPASFDGLLFPQDPLERFTETLAHENATYFAGGHTHIQFIRHFEQRFFFNPGSVGNVYSHKGPGGQYKVEPWAEYAVLTCDNGFLSLDFRRVPFDVPTLLHIARHSGRPHVEQLVEEYSQT